MDTGIISTETTPQKLAKKGAQYSEVSAELKAATIRAALLEGQELRKRNPDKIDISDLGAVKRAAEAYETSCAQVGVIPSFIGLCAVLNVSRQWLYDYCARNPRSDTAQYLDTLRHAWAAIRQQLAELRLTSEAVSIFMLKNAKLGLTDKAEVEISQNRGPFDDWERLTPEELEKKYADILASIPEEDDEEEAEGGTLYSE